MAFEEKDTAGVPFGDGWSTQDRATASCFCGAVQLEFVGHNRGAQQNVFPALPSPYRNTITTKVHVTDCLAVT